MSKNYKPEILSPGGNLEKVKVAFLYGADAVYVGTPDLSLRTKSQFSLEEIKQAKQIAENNNKKLYLTLNLFSHNKDIEKIKQAIKVIKEINPDGVLIADPGVFLYIKKNLPNINLHISTQANVCSSLTVDYWKEQGASLVVLARELSGEEVMQIKKDSPLVKIEAFVHGSMCMTYSGRCLLSNFMAERASNQGSCAHSCRWEYKLKIKLKDDKIVDFTLNEENKDLFEFFLEEEYRKGQYYEIQEDTKGSYILNAKDLCLMPVLDDYLKAKIDTFKIEGRNKSEYYVAMSAKSYKTAVNDWLQNPDTWDYNKYMEDINSIPSRGYTLGFHHGRLTNLAHNYDVTRTLGEYIYAGIIVDYVDDNIILKIKAKLVKEDVLEFISPYLVEPIRIRMYDFIDFDTDKKVDNISPGKANQRIKIPLSLFHLYNNKEELQQLLPKLSVVRKLSGYGVYDVFLNQNITSFKVENSSTSDKLLNKIKDASKDILSGSEFKNKPPKFKRRNDDGCCSKGCNGCLKFWNDDKYKELRSKLEKKDIGKLLIKHIDF